jgi:hypothetical protein
MQNVQYAAVTTKEHIDPDGRDHNAILLKDGQTPQKLRYSWIWKCLRALLDVAEATVAILFAVFGLWAYTSNGAPAYPGSEAAYIVSISKYV